MRKGIICALIMIASAVGAMAQSSESEKLEDMLRKLQVQHEQMQEQIDSLKKQIAEMKGNATKNARSPVMAGFGQIQLGGLMQNWLVGAQGGGANNTGLVRRMELKFSGAIRPDVLWWVMVNPAKTLTVNTTKVDGTEVVTGINPNSGILQDVVISYLVNPRLTVNIGQEKVPISMEALRSSAQLLTVERSLMNTLPVNNGRFGDIRDMGIHAKWTTPEANVTLALLNDSGPRQNAADNNNRKDLLYRGVYKGLRYTEVGLSGTLFTNSFGQSKVPRSRFGAELSVKYGPHIFEFEYGRAKDAVNGHVVRSEGGYGVYAYKLNPHVQLVVRGECWNTNLAIGNASERDLTLGANWLLQGHQAKIQLNWVRKDIDGGAPSFLGRSRNLFLANFQTAW